MKKIELLTLIVTWVLTVFICANCTHQKTEDDHASEVLRLATRDMERAKLVSTKSPDDQGLKRYIVDTTHSSIQFSVRHWGIYDVIGRLESYEINVSYTKDDFSDMTVEARFRPASINMPNKAMAHHVRTKGFEFFDTQDYPEVLFKSTRIEMIRDSVYKLFGEMSIKDITNDFFFNVKFNGYTHPPTKTGPGFTITGKISRQDFNLGGSDLLPGNALPLIGNEVYLTSNVRLISGYD